MISQHTTPTHKHARRRKIHQPPKHRQRATTQTHKRQKHKRRIEAHAYIGHAPWRGAEEDAGGLVFDGEAVEDAGAREEGLVGGGPGGGYDDGVDEGGKDADAGGGGDDYEGGLGGGAGCGGEAGVGAGYYHAYDEDCVDINMASAAIGRRW